VRLKKADKHTLGQQFADLNKATTAPLSFSLPPSLHLPLPSSLSLPLCLLLYPWCARCSCCVKSQPWNPFVSLSAHGAACCVALTGILRPWARLAVLRRRVEALGVTWYIQSGWRLLKELALCGVPAKSDR